MPVPAYARDVAGRAGAVLKPIHVVIIGVGVVGIAALALMAARQSSGGIKTPARTTEDLPAFTPPLDQPWVGTQQHLNGFIFTPHRYPPNCGQEITAFINGGHATLQIPHERDMTWLTAPPGEVSL
jgi:hypothetical protein